MNTETAPLASIEALVLPRESARISINKLGEYLSAGPARRRTILTEQRNPRIFQVTWYRLAERAIRRFLVDHLDDPDRFTHELEALRSSETSTRHEEVRRATNVAAMEAFQTLVQTLPLDELSLFEAHDDAPHVVFGGVDVSVRPEVIVTGSDSKGLPRVGAIKLLLSQGHPLDETTGLYSATVLHHFVEQHLGDLGRADPQLCFVVDVFQQKVWTAPRHSKRRAQDIGAACEEIAAMWG